MASSLNQLSKTLVMNIKVMLNRHLMPLVGRLRTGLNNPYVGLRFFSTSIFKCSPPCGKTKEKSFAFTWYFRHRQDRPFCRHLLIPTLKTRFSKPFSSIRKTYACQIRRWKLIRCTMFIPFSSSYSLWPNHCQITHFRVLFPGMLYSASNTGFIMSKIKSKPYRNPIREQLFLISKEPHLVWLLQSLKDSCNTS